MALSGLLLQVPVAAGEAARSGTDLRGGTALRIFHPGETLTYSFQVLNPKRGRGKQGPRVESQVLLYRDGRLLFTGKKTPVEAGSDPQRLPAGGNLKIGPEMPPGQYVLEAAVTDLLAAQGSATVKHYIDFRVAP